MNSEWVSVANQWAAAAAPGLWRATWQGSVFVLAVWAICKLARRMPAWTRYWLWWLACSQMLARIVLPSFSLPILPPAPSDGVSVVQTTALSGNRPDDGVVLVAPPSISRPASEPPSPELLLMLAYAAGLAFFGTVGARRLRRTWRMLAQSQVCDRPEVTGALAEICRKKGLSPPRILESSYAPCPLLTGWRRPAIVLPKGFATGLAEEDARMALSHEIAHLGRCDLWLALALAAARAVFFFNPLAWLASHEALAASEEACDLEALRVSGASPAAYARLLFCSAQSGPSVAALGAALGFRLLHRRITMLNRSTLTPGGRYRRACTLLVALCAVCALPWSVTAQSSTGSSAKASQQTKKVVRHPAKRVHSKKSTKTSKAATFVIRSTGVSKGNASYTVVTATGTGKPGVYTITSSPAHGTGAAKGSVSYSVVRSASAPAQASTPMAYTLTTEAHPGAEGRGRTIYVAGGSTAEPVRAGSTVTLSETVQAASAPTGAGGSHWVTVTAGAPGKVSVSLQGIDLRQALMEIFHSARLNFVVSSEVQPELVTGSFTDAPIETVLRSLLNSTKQHLAYKVEDGVYQITVRN